MAACHRSVNEVEFCSHVAVILRKILCEAPPPPPAV